jgi:hypothetical protein
VRKALASNAGAAWDIAAGGVADCDTAEFDDAGVFDAAGLSDPAELADGDCVVWSDVAVELVSGGVAGCEGVSAADAVAATDAALGFCDALGLVLSVSCDWCGVNTVASSFASVSIDPMMTFKNCRVLVNGLAELDAVSACASGESARRMTNAAAAMRCPTFIRCDVDCQPPYFVR